MTTHTAGEGLIVSYANNKYLDRLAHQLKIDKNAACRRAIERILAMVKKRCDEGVYKSRTAAELDLRRFVEQQGTCKKPKSAPRLPPKNRTRR
jgi:hypothetical protein